MSVIQFLVGWLSLIPKITLGFTWFAGTFVTDETVKVPRECGNRHFYYIIIGQVGMNDTISNVYLPIGLFVWWLLHTKPLVKSTDPKRIGKGRPGSPVKIKVLRTRDFSQLSELS